MTGQKMSAHLIESLADELRNWLEDNELWSDCRIYFNGKAYSTDNGSGQYDSKKHHGWYELEDIDIAFSMTFELLRVSKLLMSQLKSF